MNGKYDAKVILFRDGKNENLPRLHAQKKKNRACQHYNMVRLSPMTTGLPFAGPISGLGYP